MSLGKRAMQKRLNALCKLRRILSRLEFPTVKAVFRTGTVSNLVQCLSFGCPNEKNKKGVIRKQQIGFSAAPLGKELMEECVKMFLMVQFFRPINRVDRIQFLATRGALLHVNLQQALSARSSISPWLLRLLLFVKIFGTILLCHASLGKSSSLQIMRCGRDV